MTSEDELLGDFRPGFTLWRKSTGRVDVVVAQMEGGELCSEDVEEGLALMKRAILESRRYVTLYDLTLQDAKACKLLPHAPSLISFAAEMKAVSQEKQDCMVAVCSDERTRNWIRWLLGVLSQRLRYAIFKTSEEAWEFLARGIAAQEEASFDAFGEDFSMPLSLSALGDASLP